MSPQYGFAHLEYVLRCVPSTGPEATVLAQDWRSKDEFLGVQLTELDECAKVFASTPRLRDPENPRLLRFDRQPGVRLASIAEATANSVYSIHEIAAKLANRVSRGALSSKFNVLQKRAEKNPASRRWFSVSEIRCYRRVRELRVEWTHHSAVFVVPSDQGAALVVKDTRGSGDRLEFAEHSVCTVTDLIEWSKGARALLDRFAGYLLDEYVLGLYDPERVIVAPTYDRQGNMVITSTGLVTRRIAVRQFFAEGGVRI